MSEGERELPMGWRYALFNDVIDLHDNERKPINRKERDVRLENSDKRFPYYGATGQVGFIDDYLSEIESILLGEDGAPFLNPYKKKAYVVGGQFWVNNHAHILRAKSNQPNDFYCHQLNQFNYRGYVSGTTRLKLTQSSIRKMSFLVPPLAEQSRIVDKIDELFSSIEAGERAIARARTALTRYRKAVLKAAVTGDLTADWRAKNPPTETAEALLERILKARYEAWEKVELEKLDAKEKARPKTEKQWETFRARYKVPAEPKIDKLPDLPDYWFWDTIDRTTKFFGNGLSGKPLPEFSNFPILRISAVREMSVNASDTRFYHPKENEDVGKYWVKSGDLLFTRYNGSMFLVGVCGLYKAVDQCLHPDKLMRAELADKKSTLPEWVEIACNAGETSKFIADNVKTSAGQHGISGTDVKRSVYPIPPFEEQAEIVSRVEQALSKADKAEATLDAQAKQAKALKQAVLKTAFEGRLVPQDPNDEPASELLKRIKAAT